MPDEFADHEEAVRDYSDSTDPYLVARLIGELHELLALHLDESDCALAVAELGMEVEPPQPCTPGAWLAAVADELGRFRAEYEGPDGAAQYCNHRYW